MRRLTVLPLMKILPLISVLLVSLAGMAQMGGNGISSGASGLGPTVNVTRYGAVGDGTTDNCTALTNASNAALAANGVLYFPPAAASFNTSCTVIFQSNWWVEGSLRAIAGGTAASVALVSTGTATTIQNKGIYGPGSIDANFISPIDVWVMQGKHINIALGSIIGMAVNGIGVYLGDDAGVGAGGYEGSIYGVGFGLSSNPTHTGSTCVYISNGNGTQGAFTDDSVRNNVLHGCATGYQDKVGGNNKFNDNHAWDTAMTTCFEEFNTRGTMTNEYCDTPSLYGFRIHSTGTIINGGTAYNNNTFGTNGVATAIQFDVSADPSALVRGIRIYGQDASHQWAADTNMGFAATNSVWCDVRDQSNIVTKQFGTQKCIQTNTLTQLGSVLLKTGGMYAAIPASFSCTSVCAFSSGGNFQKATLTQNATSTFTVVSPDPSSYSTFTIMVCQPAGGPFTFAWPANSVGGGTIGTTASKCSVQEFVWDGTTLRAVSPIQINE
jgi:hypothetical protein